VAGTGGKRTATVAAGQFDEILFADGFVYWTDGSGAIVKVSAP
jgi:hypothetical protein